MAQVTASVTIGFVLPDDALGANGQPVFRAEVDTRDAGLNQGKSQFPPGSAVYILLYKANVTGVTVVPSDGACSLYGAEIPITITNELVTCANTDEFNIQFPPTGPVTFTWFGANPGAPAGPSGGTKFKFAEKKITVGYASYTTYAQPYVLEGVSVNYPAAVVMFFGNDLNP